MQASRISLAHWIALLLPAALLAGALGSQYIGGLFPCEMCHWQRWPHYGAVVVAALGSLAVRTRIRVPLIAVAGLLIALSGLIGIFHAGVEYHWWQGITPCSTTFTAHGGDFMDQLMNAPVVRCDVPQWSLFGISLAGFNAIFSLGGAAVIFALLTKGRR